MVDSRVRARTSSAWRRFVPLVAAAAVLVALGACTSREEKNRQQGFCPKGFTVGDAASLTRFKPGPGRDPTDVQFRAQVVKVESSCDFDKSGVDIATKVTIGVLEGPAAINRRANVGYFVAIIDPSRKVVARQEFAADFTFEGNHNRLASVEELSERLPGVNTTNAQDYQIAVGLLVSPDELQYNRARQR